MRKLFSVLLVAVMAVGFTGCGAKSEPAGDKLPVIGVTIYKYDDNFMSFTRTAINNAAEGKAELIMNDSQNDQAKQNDQIDAMIAKKVDALAINLVDPGAAASIAEKAEAAGIPVVFFNKEYPEGTDKIPYEDTIYVGTNSAESGVIQGELILDAWKENPEWDKNGDGVLQYVMLLGEPGHPDAEARTKESIATLEAAGVKTEEIALQAAMWDASKAKEFMETWLAAHGDKIEMVISNNDGMALGAVEALKAAGYFTDGKYMPVVGVDAIPEALELIKEEQLLGTVLNDPLNQGKATIELAINAALGKDFLEGTSWEVDATKAVRIPYVAITSDNLGVAQEAYGLDQD